MEIRIAPPTLFNYYQNKPLQSGQFLHTAHSFFTLSDEVTLNYLIITLSY